MRSHLLNRIEFVTRIIIVTVFLMGCAGQAKNVQPADQPPNPSSNETPLPVPESLKEKIRLSEGLGAELYLNDKIATIGTDVMLEKLDDSQKAGVCGYIVFREGNEQNRPTGSWCVEFFVDKSDPKVGYKVRITPPETTGRASTQFEALTPPRKPSDGELAFFRSTRSAIEGIPDRPNQPVNPVVLPGTALGEDGILVYLLAASKRDNVVVYGKHYRVLVSNDGKTVRRIEPLTKTPLETDTTSKDGSKPVALIVSHLLGDYPLETHVFISRLHHMDLFVMTEKYMWRISKGKIDLIRLTNDKRKSEPGK